MIHKIEWTNKDIISNAVKQSRSKTDALYRLGLSSTGSANRLRLNEAIRIFNIDTSHFENNRVPWHLLPEIIAKSSNITEILRHLGLFNRGNNYKTVKSNIVKQNIDTSHINFAKKLPISHIKKQFDEVFCENGMVNRSTVRAWIIRDNLLPYVCSKCNNEGFWNEKNLTLQVEHKNGISNDNRIENLEFLCPNCHTQTKTWGRKKR